MEMIKKLKIGNTPTPIFKINSLSDRYSTNIFIKRDDFSGIEFSGNKVRKLEYLFGDILSNNYDTVITTGGVQSNHARATAAVAAMFGIKCYLVLNGKEEEFEGNLFLDRAFGAEIIFSSSPEAEMESLKKELTEKGRKVYIIPMGGSNELGSHGYLDEFKEILDYEKDNNIKFSTITLATGSGGTYAGLYYGNYLLDSGFKTIYGVSVNNSEEFFKEKIGKILKNIDGDVDVSKISINDNFIGEGYAKFNEDEMRFYLEIAKETGILLDPCYTGKAFRGFISMIENNVLNREDNHLFIHTGGIFGYTKEMRSMMKKIMEE